MDYPYIYSWGPRGHLAGAMNRKGQRCRIVAPPPGKKAGMNSALIEFAEDKFLALISRNALRRLKPLPCVSEAGNSLTAKSFQVD